SADGEYFNECIDKVTKDEHEIEKLLKNQISVTSSVIKSFNSTIQSFRIDEETFNQDLTQIQKSLYDISDTVAFYESQIKTLNLCESLMESYVYLESYLSDILNAITFARIKVLHSSIIYPRDLVISLQEISKSLTKNNLPLPPYTSSIARYVDIMELKAFQTENKVVFVPRIPLIEPEIYTLYRVLPIPILDNRTRLFHIIPSTIKYIARDDDSLLYVLPEDLKSCKQIRGKERICFNLMQYPIDREALCEAQLLRHSDRVPVTCQSSIVLASDYNVIEIDFNYWLITVSEPLPISIKCGKRDLVAEMLKTNSLLKLQADCSAFIGSSRVRAKYFVEEYKNVTYKSHAVEIPYDCCSHIPEKFQPPELKPLKLSKIDTDDLNVAQHKLHEYSEKLENLLHQPTLQKHSHWLTIISIILMTVLVLCYFVCKCRRKKPTTLSIADGNDPQQPPKPSRRPLLPMQLKSLTPKRRTSIHPEVTTREATL
ncbi:uncharacterized protein LOC132705358, partial [Cylas formicarius]|uniref:uncharacterized protein LOC132705358 n=1 Tax=Cylas formicarius TaxID=197179 RepID=UPI00295832E7